MRLLPTVLLTSIIVCLASGQTYTINPFAGGGLPVNIPGISASLGGGRSGSTTVAVDSAGNVFLTSVQYNVVLRLNTQTGVLTLVAGNGTAGFSGDNGPATSAQLNTPSGVAVDSAGNLYIADSNNNRVRKVSNGVITTVAGNGVFGFSGDNGPATSAQVAPLGLAVDSAGNLYIADFDNSLIRKVSNGVITTVAGNGTFGFSGDNGPAISAQLNQPTGVAVDSASNLYIADIDNQRIRKVSNGVITTVAGNGTSGFGGDSGPATSAQLVHPTGVALDSAGNLYIGDLVRVRKVSNGIITTVAGGGSVLGDNGPATSAQLVGAANLFGVALDSTGSLYIADGNQRIRKVSNGVITTVAGGGSSLGDNGPAISAQLASPSGVAVDSAGNLYMADTSNNRIRKVSPSGIITTVAGNGTAGFSGDKGPATSAQLNIPSGVALDSTGNLYIADSGNYRIRKVSNGVITTVAGIGLGDSLGDNGPAISAQLLSDQSVAVDSTGNLYIADYADNAIRRVSDGVITTVAGNGTAGFTGDNGPATSAQLNNPHGVAVDSADNLYIADSGNSRIRKVSNGVITTVAGGGSVLGDNGPATSAQLGFPSTVTVDSAGNLYIVDIGNNNNNNLTRIRRVSNGVITNVTGNGTQGFSYPGGIALDSASNLYVADTTNNRILVLMPPPSCTYSASPTTFQFSVSGGNLNISIQATSSCSWTISGLPSWISVSGTSSGTGSANVTLLIAANTGAARNATISVAGISVAVAQAGTGGATVLLTGVQNAASYDPGQVAPGEIVVLSGSGMGPTQLTQFQVDSRGYIPAQLAGIQVLFNGVAAPIIYTRSDVVAAIVPYEVTGNTTTIVVQYQGQSSSPLSVPVVGTLPGLFTAGATGSGQAAAINQDGSYNTVTTPAKIGSTISLYATGEGQTSPGGVDGKPAAVPLPQPLQSVFVTIGGISAEVDYAGGAPTLVAGVMQINVRIPSVVQPGSSVQVVVKVGNTSSQTGVAIAVAGN